jgi:hypothetical protein
MEDDIRPGGIVEPFYMRLHCEIALGAPRHDDLVVRHATLAEHTKHGLPQKTCASGHDDPFS